MELSKKRRRALLALALTAVLGMGVTPAWAGVTPTEGQNVVAGKTTAEQAETSAPMLDAEDTGEAAAPQELALPAQEAPLPEEAKSPAPADENEAQATDAEVGSAPAGDGAKTDQQEATKAEPATKAAGQTPASGDGADDGSGSTMAELEELSKTTDVDELVASKPQVVRDEAPLQLRKLAKTASVKSIEMMRLYNPNSGEHFYTSNAEEVANLRSLGWRLESVGWVAPETSNVPVYRLYNPNAGDHHYTTSAEERDDLVRLGWHDEGIGWYSDSGETVALLRQYNPNAKAGAHNFTTSKEENDSLVRLGWRAEGIGWYALAAGYAIDPKETSYIYLDAGHGWQSNRPTKWDPGAQGNGYDEADLTHDLTARVAKYARELYGLRVYNNGDAGPSLVDYSGRQADAKSRGCTSLVSIHFNANEDPRATGYESYRHSETPHPRSARLQSIMHAQLTSTGLRNRGARSADIAVVSGRNDGLPATLLEICFVTNPYDMRQYMANRDKVARALAKGLYEAAQAGF